MKNPLVILVIASLVLGLLIFVPDAEAASNNKPDQRAASVRHQSESVRFQPVGHQIKALPAGYRRVTVGGGNYFYHGGVFYRPQASTYVVINAPIGARVSGLPGSYVSFSIGTHRYFYANATYYFFEPKAQEYVVVAEPEGADEALNAAESAGQLFVYPNEGQTEEQTRQDRYECYVWASEQSGFDPALPDQPTKFQYDYDRALSACLTGRGYTVN